MSLDISQRMYTHYGYCTLWFPLLRLETRHCLSCSVWKKYITCISATKPYLLILHARLFIHSIYPLKNSASQSSSVATFDHFSCLTMSPEAHYDVGILWRITLKKWNISANLVLRCIESPTPKWGLWPTEQQAWLDHDCHMVQHLLPRWVRENCLNHLKRERNLKWVNRIECYSSIYPGFSRNFCPRPFFQSDVHNFVIFELKWYHEWLLLFYLTVRVQ